MLIDSEMVLMYKVDNKKQQKIQKNAIIYFSKKTSHKSDKSLNICV